MLSHVIAVGSERLGRQATWDELVELVQEERSAAGLRGRGSRAADEGRSGSGVPHRRYGRRRLRSGRARRASGPRLAHHLGFAPGRPPGAGDRLDAGREGRRDRICRARARQRSARRCRTRFITTARSGIFPRRESRRRPRRRNDERAGCAGPRLSEADLDTAPAAGIGGSRDP